MFHNSRLNAGRSPDRVETSFTSASRNRLGSSNMMKWELRSKVMNFWAGASIRPKWALDSSCGVCRSYHPIRRITGTLNKSRRSVGVSASGPRPPRGAR